MEPATKKQRLDALLHLAAAQQWKQQRRAAHEQRQTEAVRSAPVEAQEAERSTRWSVREHDKLRRLVAESGAGDWSGVARALGSARDRKRCRERWVNHAGARREPWTEAEDERATELRARVGPRWAKIAGELGGRAPQDVRNRLGVLDRRSSRRTEQHNGEEERPTAWTKQETEELRALVGKHGPSNWLLIASQLHAGRTDQQCLQHWYRVANGVIVKGKGSWSKDEDAALLAKVRELGSNWAQVRGICSNRTMLPLWLMATADCNVPAGACGQTMQGTLSEPRRSNP